MRPLSPPFRLACAYETRRLACADTRRYPRHARINCLFEQCVLRLGEIRQIGQYLCGAGGQGRRQTARACLVRVGCSSLPPPPCVLRLLLVLVCISAPLLDCCPMTSAGCQLRHALADHITPGTGTERRRQRRRQRWRCCQGVKAACECEARRYRAGT